MREDVREDVKMSRCERRCEDEKMFYRPPLLEEPCAQTLSGKTEKNKWSVGDRAGKEPVAPPSVAAAPWILVSTIWRKCQEILYIDVFIVYIHIYIYSILYYLYIYILYIISFSVLDLFLICFSARFPC